MSALSTGRLRIIAVAAIGLSALPAQAGRSTSKSASSPVAYPVLGDLNADCVVNTADKLALLGAWGGSGGDLNGDGTTDGIDADMMVAVFGATGAQRLIGDVDCSGVVNTSDLTALLGMYGTTNPLGDCDGDGDVDVVDKDLLLANFGATMGARILGDVNGDNRVSTTDLLILSSAWGTSGSPADINEDGTVDDIDKDLLLARFGQIAGQDLVGDIDGNDVVDGVDEDLLVAVMGTTWAQADLDGSGTVASGDLTLLLGAFGDRAGDLYNLPGDVDGDWVVDDVDTDMLIATFGTGWAPADLNDSGVVNTADLLSLLSGFGESYATSFTGDVDGDCVVTATDQDLLLAVFGTAWVQADVNGSGGSVNTSDLLILNSNIGVSCP